MIRCEPRAKRSEYNIPLNSRRRGAANADGDLDSADPLAPRPASLDRSIRSFALNVSSCHEFTALWKNYRANEEIAWVVVRSCGYINDFVSHLQSSFEVSFLSQQNVVVSGAISVLAHQF